MRKLVTGIALGVALATATACSPPPERPDLARSAEEIITDNGLVIDGEQIADPDLWTQAQAEGGITLYSGYTAVTEATVLKNFEKEEDLPVQNPEQPAKPAKSKKKKVSKKSKGSPAAAVAGKSTLDAIADAIAASAKK